MVRYANSYLVGAALSVAVVAAGIVFSMALVFFQGFAELPGIGPIAAEEGKDRGGRDSRAASQVEPAAARAVLSTPTTAASDGGRIATTGKPQRSASLTVRRALVRGEAVPQAPPARAKKKPPPAPESAPAREDVPVPATSPSESPRPDEGPAGGPDLGGGAGGAGRKLAAGRDGGPPPGLAKKSSEESAGGGGEAPASKGKGPPPHAASRP